MQKETEAEANRPVYQGDNAMMICQLPQPVKRPLVKLSLATGVAFDWKNWKPRLPIWIMNSPKLRANWRILLTMPESPTLREEYVSLQSKLDGLMAEWKNFRRISETYVLTYVPPIAQIQEIVSNRAVAKLGDSGKIRLNWLRRSIPPPSKQISLQNQLLCNLLTVTLVDQQIK